jgi:hypothetical protein
MQPMIRAGIPQNRTSATLPKNFNIFVSISIFFLGDVEAATVCGGSDSCAYRIQLSSLDWLDLLYHHLARKYLTAIRQYPECLLADLKSELFERMMENEVIGKK